MKVSVALLIVGVVGTIGRGADLDINRVKQISSQDELFQENYRQSLRTNDYDDHSSWYQYAQRLTPPHAPETSKVPVQIHQPREDPRLYYLSDAYLKEYPREKVNEEVTFVYPGQDVVRAGEPSRLSRIQSNDVNAATQDVNICVKCPHDLTLIAKQSVGKVVLQNPTLRACSGRKAPRNVRFVHMYGPKIGSLLKQGSHMVIGRIMYKNKNLQLCKMQVHVVTQGCVTPKHLEAHCWDHNKQCNFTCINKHLELSGPKSQVCGDDMTWKGDLPVCKARTWCEFPQPPERGRVSCQGATAGNGVAEGSRCRVMCMRGYRSSRGTPVCRRGAWTNTLSCQPIRKRNTKQVVLRRRNTTGFGTGIE